MIRLQVLRKYGADNYLAFFTNLKLINEGDDNMFKIEANNFVKDYTYNNFLRTIPDCNFVGM
jgi:hypothetical protein